MMTLRTVILFIAVFSAGITQAQEHTETLKEVLAFDSRSLDNTLIVYNVDGPIHIEAYQGNEVDILVKKTIKAKSQSRLEKGKAEVNLVVEKHGNSIYAYMKSPNIKLNKETGKFSHKGEWNENLYWYSMEFKIKVPQGTNLKLSTINNGEIKVEDVQAQSIKANNINGPITMDNIAGKTYVNALNKDVNINYSANPSENCQFHSLNGDINITVQKGLNADVSFESLNGDIYTNLETAYLPSEMEKTEHSGKHGTKYKINHDTRFRIGKGGVNWDFELLNGDVTIKE